MIERIVTDERLRCFESYLLENEKSCATIEKYMRDLQYFSVFAQNHSVDKTLTLSYKAHLEREYAQTSANSMIAALNTFLRFMGWHDCCVKQFKIQRKTYCPEEKELTKGEYLALIRTAERKQNERLSLLLQTICATGIRVSELNYITVEAVQKGEAIVSCKGKTRTVFIVTALRRKLRDYARKHKILSGLIFITRNGKPLNRSNIWHEMKKLCEEAGVSSGKVFPHNLRHLFARIFYSIEKDIAKLADVLGHSNINITRIYIVSTGAEHRQRMEKMCLIT